MKKPYSFIQPGLLIILLYVIIPLRSSSQTGSQTFNYTTSGAEQSFTVPPGVTSITVHAWGGGGGSGSNTGNTSYTTHGGGGGAYAGSNKTGLTSGTSFKLIVGDGGVGNRGTQGGSGGNSSFNNNEIVAAGGTGGYSSGGAGGTTAASTGATKYAGGAGGARVASSSGGGGGGGGSAGATGNGGAGGNASSSTGGTAGTAGSGTPGGAAGGAGGNNGSAGTNGTVHGGGGGGQGYGGSSTGNGANGQVIVTWTCPTSAGTLSGTQSICMGGTTTFSSTVAGGTWSSSNINIASINPTTGVITTGSTAGTATITYTVAAGGGCSPQTVTRDITVRPQFTAGAIATTGQTICYNTVPTTQIGSATAASGGDNSIAYQWQYSTDNTFNTGVTTVASNTATYTPTQTLTQTTYYRRQAHDGTCNTAWEISTGLWSVIVDPVSVGGTITANTNALCAGNSGTDISLSGNTGNIQWQYSTNETDWYNVGSGGTPYNTGALSVTTYFRAVVTSGVCASENSNVAGVYLNPTYRWNGNTDNDWTQSSNWKFDGYDESPNVSPPSCSDVIIPNIGSDNYPTLASSTAVHNLTMGDGASLMGNNYLTVSGTATMKKIINDTWNWHLMSSPVPSQYIWDQFAPIPSGSGYSTWTWPVADIDWDFYYFNPKVTNVYPNVPWVNIRKAASGNDFPYNYGPVDATTPNGTGADAGFGQAQPYFTPGRGYLIAYDNTSYATEHSFTASGTEHLNDGDYVVTLSTTGSNFHLVGNPYPSSIDWGSSSWGTGRAGLRASGSGFDYWIWDDSGSGNYRTGNSGGTYGTGISRYIAPMQGFFVKADSLVTGGTFTMTNSVRAHSAQSWVKSDEIQNNILRLKLSTDQNNYWDEMIVDFNSSYSGDEGSPKLASWYTSAPEIWSLKNGNRYTFDRYKEISSALEVNVNVKCGVSGPYTISATNIDEFDLSNIVYLEDLKTGNKVNLKEVGSYSFTGGPNDDKARFRVTFAEITGTNDAALQNPVYIYSFEKDVFVNAGSLTTGSCDVYIYDAIGRLVYNGRYIPVAGNHKFTTLQTPGAYVVKVISHSGTTTAKVIIP